MLINTIWEYVIKQKNTITDYYYHELTNEYID